MHSVLSTLVTILTTIDSLLLLRLYWCDSGCKRCPLLHQYFDGNYQRLQDAIGCWQLVKLKMVKSCQSSAYTISWLSKSTKCLVYCVFGNICHSFDLMAGTGRGSGWVCRKRYKVHGQSRDLLNVLRHILHSTKHSAVSAFAILFPWAFLQSQQEKGWQ